MNCFKPVDFGDCLRLGCPSKLASKRATQRKEVTSKPSNSLRKTRRFLGKFNVKRPRTELSGRGPEEKVAVEALSLWRTSFLNCS